MVNTRPSPRIRDTKHVHEKYLSSKPGMIKVVQVVNEQQSLGYFHALFSMHIKAITKH